MTDSADAPPTVADVSANDVAWLRMAYEAADPDERARSAGLFGLALAQLLEQESDGAELPGRLDEAIRVLDEAGADPEIAAQLGARLPLARGLARWRRATGERLEAPEPAVLDAVVADLTRALGRAWSAPSVTGDLAGAQWCLSAALVLRERLTGRTDDRPAAMAHAVEALAAEAAIGAAQRRPGTERLSRQGRAIAQGAGQALGSLSPSEWPAAAPRLRVLLRSLPATNPLRPLLRLAAVSDVLNDLLLTRRWPEPAEQTLLELRALLSSAPELGDAERTIARAQTVLLGAFRIYAAGQPAGPSRADFAELDGIAGELEALTAIEATGVGAQLAGSMEKLLGLAQQLVGGLLAMRAAVDVAADRQPDPADLRRSESLLAGLPLQERAAMESFGPLLNLAQGDFGDDDPQVQKLIGKLRQPAPDITDELGIGIGEAMALARRAAKTADVREISHALDVTQKVLRELSAGHPARSGLMALRSNLLGIRAALTSTPQDAAAALDAAVSAAEVGALLNREQGAAVLDSIVLSLSSAVGQDLRVGPFSRAQAVLETALAADGAADDSRRFRLTLGLGTALALQWPAGPDHRDRTRRMLADARRLLGRLPDEAATVSHGIALFLTLGRLAALQDDEACGAEAERVLDDMDALLRRSPGVAGQLSAVLPGGMPGTAGLPPGAAGVRAALAQLRSSLGTLRGQKAPPMPAPPSPAEIEQLVEEGLSVARDALGSGSSGDLEVAVTTLTRLLAGSVTGPGRRASVRAALGRCLAACAGLGRDPDADHLPDTADLRARARLQEAVGQLELTGAEPAEVLPTVERAELLDLLARCYWAQAAPALALDTCRAALRELFGAVVVGGGPDTALAVAAVANRVARHAVEWCLAGGDPGRAVSMAESGRSLVLTSVVLAGRAGQLLTDLGRPDLAAGWAARDPHDMVAGLGELTRSNAGIALTAPPAWSEVAGWVHAGGMDAAAYIVPPAPGRRSGHVLLLSARDRGVQVLPLPDLDTGPGSPPATYQEAFADALAAAGPTDRAGRPFRQTPEGLAWAAALDSLGEWAHRTIVGPLIRHVATWNLHWEPHLVLIPTGSLGGVPFAAAWRPDPTVPGGRRYAIHDLVLTQAASARVLFDAARRERLPVGPVVLVTDPTGEFPAARSAARAIARLYPDVTSYGPGDDPDAATLANVLAALPAPDRDGAALIHLSTHGTAALPAVDSRLQASDGWLRLGDVLDQARSRRPDAPGGLVICDACLTDSTLVDQDESLTLATAFLTAGATAVIGTRWPTDDDTAAVMALRLHHELASGVSPARALRQAQLDMLDPRAPEPPGASAMLRRPRYPGYWAEPASWAAYVHHGI